MINKAFLIFACLFLVLSQQAQEIQHEAVAVNIEVPVRVYDGTTFIDTLRIDDFEVYEDGELQKVEAVYLIKKTTVEKEEGEKKYNPEVSRNFTLIFILTDYLPKVREGLEYFFDNVFLETDTLSVVTPIKPYNLKREVLAKLSREGIKEQLNSLLRKDIILGNTEYKSILRDLKRYAGAQDEQNYAFAMARFEKIRHIEQKSLEDFSRFLKAKEGQKFVFLFYQQELVPYLEADILVSPNPSEDLNWLLPGSKEPFLNTYFEHITFDVEAIKQMYSDSSIALHFLYIKSPLGVDTGGMTLPTNPGARYIEKSGTIFKAFEEMANTTGGIISSTANIPYAFEVAAKASEHYYLLYYSPKNYKTDGKFKNIEVKVKGGRYKITHRGGYFAD